MNPPTHTNFIPCNNHALVAQIGTWNILATSGGRIIGRETGITLPVAYGYSVDVDLNSRDLYTVQRIFTRGARRFDKGTATDVDATQVGKAVYRAGCYLHPFPERKED